MIGAVVQSGVAELTIDRPPVNAFSSGLWQEVIAQLSNVSANSDVAVVILTAAGTRAFSAGADTRETTALGREEREIRAKLVSEGLQSVYSFPLPIICAINGPAAGGGVNVAALCDYRIASENAHFSLPEIRHGASAGGGAFLRNIGVPEGAIRRLLFAAERIDAARALEIHLVDEVVPAGSHLERARALAHQVALQGREALSTMKAAIIAARSESDLFEAYARAHETGRIKSSFIRQEQQ